jgi:hypothetical protein
MKRRFKLIGLFLFAACTVSLASCEKRIDTGSGDLGVADAGEAPARRVPMKIEPQADRLLREMGEYLKTAREFAFHAEITNEDVGSSGQKIQYGGATDVSVRRPNQFYVRFDGDERKTRTFYNGKTITIHDAIMNVYAVTEVPAKIDDAVDLILDKFGFTVPIADLVYEDPYAILMEYVQSASLVGVHAVDGVLCNHLAFTQEAIDWQIWITDGPRPVPRKMVITYINEEGSPQYTAKLSGWDFQPRLSDHAFTFHPPSGASPIEFLPIQQKESE